MAEIKQINVSFEYNPETDEVSKIVTTVNGVEQKKKTTRKKKDVEVEQSTDTEALITLDDKRLIINGLAAEMLGLDPDSRVDVRYQKDKKTKKSFPVIGKDTDFDEEGSGNKISQPKSGDYKGKTTLMYGGKKNAFLADYGNEFRLVEYSPGIFRMIGNIEPKAKTPVAKAQIDNIEDLADDLDMTPITDDAIEIDDMPFSL